MTRWIDFARLARLPNAFTIVSNVLVAQLFFAGSWSWQLLFVVPISLACYFYGMLRNDLLDLDADRAARPERPLPSQAVSVISAKRITQVLLVLAFGGGLAFSLLTGEYVFLVLLLLLLGLTEIYNRGAKEYWFGNLVMGGCRTVNALLVTSHLFSDAQLVDGWKSPWLYAAGIGAYVVGVTQFARNEEGVSKVRDLLVGLSIMIAGLALVFVVSTQTAAIVNARDQLMLLAIFAALLMPVIRSCSAALLNPQPGLVQRSIGTCLRSIIVVDAFACYVLRTTQPWMAILIMLMLLPNLLLSLKIRASWRG